MPFRSFARSGFLAIPVLASAGGCYPASDFTPEPAAADERPAADAELLADTARYAWSACRGFAARRLRDPQSAEWPDFQSSEVHVQRVAGPTDRFGVISSVTAPDSRGRMARQTVVCLLDWKPDRRQWEAVTVTSKYGGMDDPGTPIVLP